MLFNSFDFAIFLPIVFFLYWFVFSKSIQIQNGFLVIASYVFYSWWDWRFCGLIAFSTLLDYWVSKQIQKNQSNSSRKKLFLAVSLIANLGLLGFFKYYNFFVDNFVHAFSFLGHEFNPDRLDIILPVGISFYTFQTLSYTIDVYRGNISSSKNLVTFAAYVSFFPQMVAGPIERATNFLPQFTKERTFNYSHAIDGCKQILWGLVKKVVIADNCAEYVDYTFGHYDSLSASSLWMGAVFFAFQIYGDFSGYSDIAIGTSRLFGFRLMKNFSFPYFSRDIAEFWRRWHISLSTWFRDYLYIPLGGSKVSTIKVVRNTFIIFLVSGFWHGANWTFIAWGALNALYILPLVLRKKNRKHLSTVSDDKLFPSLKEFSQILLTFTLTTIAWVFFRSTSIQEAFVYTSKLFNKSILSIPTKFEDYYVTTLFVLAFITFEWIGRRNEYGLEKTGNRWPYLVRYSLYLILAITVLLYSGSEQEFIYFQF